MCGLVGGEDPDADWLYFLLLRLALTLRAVCTWTPAGVGTCLSSGMLQGNASSDRHMPFTLKVPDWAIQSFKRTKNLPQICSSHEQITMIWCPEGHVDALPWHDMTWHLKEGLPGNTSFSNLEYPVYGIWSPGNQVCHFSGSFHSLHGDWGPVMNGGNLLLQPLPSLSSSPPCLYLLFVAMS